MSEFVEELFEGLDMEVSELLRFLFMRMEL